MFFNRPLQQSGPQKLGRGFLVLRLRSFILALRNDARWYMGQPDRRVGLVDVLAARPGGAEGVDSDLVPVQLNLEVALDFRQHLHQGKRGVAALLRIERADPDQPVDTPLGLEKAVRVAAVDGDGNALDAGLLTVGLVEDLRAEAVALGPAEIHPQQDFGPISGLGSACPGADGQEGVALVVFATEEQVAAGNAVLGFQYRSLASDVVQEALVVFLLGESEKLEGRPGARFQVPPELEFFAESLRFAKGLLRNPLIVPETRLADGSVKSG